MKIKALIRLIKSYINRNIKVKVWYVVRYEDDDSKVLITKHKRVLNMWVKKHYYTGYRSFSTYKYWKDRHGIIRVKKLAKIEKLGNYVLTWPQ